MDIYILDALLRPVDVVDKFVSFIWTERFAGMGDFELVTLSNSANRKRFVADTMLSIPDSKRIMRVKTVEEKISEEAGEVLKIKGKELVQVAEERTVISIGVGGTPIYPTYDIYGTTPRAAMEFFFFTICVWGDNDPADVLPFMQPQEAPSLYPADTIPDPPGTISWTQEPSSLYQTLLDISEAYDMGFRLYKDPNAAALYFEAYMGCDRTSSQTVYPPVIFSDDMTNLQDTTEFTSYENHYNVIQVLYIHKNDPPEGEEAIDVVDSVTVSDPQLAFSSGGFERKVKLLKITSVPDDIVDLPAYLTQLGKEELTKSRTSTVFDGEVDQDGLYLYERDYFLGDLVEVRGKNGSTAIMRVMEHIIKEDTAGKSAYPSLISKEYINPGTWASWKYDVEWSAMGSTEFWENQ